MEESDCAQRPSSPIHIHVDDLTPVHVHVKKQKKLKSSWSKAGSNKLDKSTMVSDGISSPSAAAPLNSVPRYTGTNLRSRSRSPQHPGPWIPPPAKSTRGSKYAWMGPTQRLEGSSSPLKKGDGEGDGEGELDTEDEERVLSQMRQYERTIDGLMKEVGSLKNAVEQQKKDDNIPKASVKASVESKEQELNELKNLEQHPANVSSTLLKPKSERVTLMKKLIEVEVDGQTVAAEFDRLREAVKKQRDSNVLGHLREKFLEKLSIFETSNRSLRHLLRDQHESEAAVLRLSEHRDLLQKKLDQAESVLMSLESQLCHERAEADHLQQMLIEAKARVDQDKEALKKATRAQKDKASQKENALGLANAEIMEHQSIIQDLHGDMTSLKSQVDRLTLDKKQATAEISRLNVQICEMESVFERMATDSKRSLESTTTLLHERTNDLSTCKLENDRLKMSLSICEEKLSYTQREMSRIQEIVHDYERRMDQYRTEIWEPCQNVHSHLQSRLDELAPLPELLRKTELRLQERTEELERLERQQADKDRQMKDLRHQTEKQFDMEDQRRELLLQIADKEEMMRHVNLQLQELTRENVELQRQLEAASATEMKMVDRERQKASAKDRAYHTQVLDLETQINQARNEIARLKREKEEGERKLRSQLVEVQTKLDHSESSKRHLQNYLHFIQTSYATTFGDSISTSTSAHTLASPYSSCRRSPFL